MGRIGGRRRAAYHRWQMDRGADRCVLDRRNPSISCTRTSSASSAAG